jgi:hypothetical protein
MISKTATDATILSSYTAANTLRNVRKILRRF